jgi:hypothetical protein
MKGSGHIISGPGSYIAGQAQDGAIAQNVGEKLDKEKQEGQGNPISAAAGRMCACLVGGIHG